MAGWLISVDTARLEREKLLAELPCDADDLRFRGRNLRVTPDEAALLRRLMRLDFILGDQ